ncbi:MAG: pyruvate dehydrogenase (acetyl-transferring) E1 component subunit alpha [Oceanospirillaceae bacterium]|nr:pyruvate dehydrogenase (acetyl-transferring) E1 component subunit alpha [Oceanospirillaceae bacterium]
MTTIAEFSVQYSQFLDSKSTLKITEEQLASHGINADTLLIFYKHMLLSRTFDTKAIALQRTGRLGTYPACIGQEAISTAIGLTMRSEDVFIPYYRDVSTLLIRGTKMEELLLYWGGDERGMDYSVNREDFPLNVPIASQCLHSIGVAYAFKLRQQPRVAVVVCGDGATSEGDFYEALNAAGVWQLPIVFVVINNQWAISVPRDKQSRCETLAQKAIAGGFSGEQVDGNDCIATQIQLEKAIASARAGNGPHLIEAITYRLSDHTTADDANRYRPIQELEQAQAREPIQRLANFLLERKYASESQLKEVQTQCTQAVEESVQRYLDMPPQPTSAMFEYMYQEMPEQLQQQLSQLSSHRE